MHRIVLGAVGGLEPKLSNNQRLWSVHVHLLLDTRSPAPDFAVLREAWEAVTCQRVRGGATGSLALRDDRDSRVQSTEAAAEYCTKRLDWCPDAYTMPRTAHAHLLRAIRGKRLYIAWGTGLPPRQLGPAASSV